MPYRKKYLQTITDRGNPQLAESIAKTAEDVGNKHIKNFSFSSHEIGLLFGNVQSGKTGQMFGIMCKAADLGFPAFVLLTTDNVVLQEQTLERVRSDLQGFCICGENDSGLFIQNTSPAVGYGAGFLRILSVGAPFSAFAYSVISFFQAVGQPKRSFWLAVLRKGILDIPLMFALGALFLREGITAATPVTDILCCGIAAIWLRRYLRQFGNRGMEGDGKA